MKLMKRSLVRLEHMVDVSKCACHNFDFNYVTADVMPLLNFCLVLQRECNDVWEYIKCFLPNAVHFWSDVACNGPNDGPYATTQHSAEAWQYREEKLWLFCLIYLGGKNRSKYVARIPGYHL